MGVSLDDEELPADVRRQNAAMVLREVLERLENGEIDLFVDELTHNEDRNSTLINAGDIEAFVPDGTEVDIGSYGTAWVIDGITTGELTLKYRIEEEADGAQIVPAEGGYQARDPASQTAIDLSAEVDDS